MMKKQILLFVLALLPIMASAFTGEVEIDGIKYFIKRATFGSFGYSYAS